MDAIATVHTAGINWASVVTIVASVVVIMSAVFGLLARYVATKIAGAVDRFRIESFDPLENRVTVLEERAGGRVRGRHR